MASVTQFRNQMRELLDAVDRGETVTIERYDKSYVIQRIDRTTIKTESPRRQGKTAAIRKQMDKNFEKLLKDETKICPHGFAKGMCKYSDCNDKYKRGKL